MGFVRMTRVGETQPFYDSRKDELTPKQLDYITKLESLRNKASTPVVRRRFEQMISAAFDRIEQERFENHLKGPLDD
jgi:hypothetical protein